MERKRFKYRATVKVIVQARADGVKRPEAGGTGADSPILALKQSNRKGDKPRETSWLPTLEALWNSRGRREENRGAGGKGEMSSVQALETRKLGSELGSTLSIWTRARISRD